MIRDLVIPYLGQPCFVMFANGQAEPAIVCRVYAPRPGDIVYKVAVRTLGLRLAYCPVLPIVLRRPDRPHTTGLEAVAAYVETVMDTPPLRIPEPAALWRVAEGEHPGDDLARRHRYLELMREHGHLIPNGSEDGGRRGD